MSFGTIAFKNEIYNLDYMNSEEIKNLLYKIELDRKNKIVNTKDILKKENLGE